MSSKTNEEKKKQLGMNPGTAQNRLKKNIMFHMAQKLNMDICFQCGEKIETADELSVEHKIPWLHSEDPIGLFFDLDNIAFSHLKCNTKAARAYKGPKPYQKEYTEKVLKSGEKACSVCKEIKPLEEFSVDNRASTGRKHFCKECRRIERIEKGY